MADEATSTTKHKPAPVPGADNYRVLKNTCASYLDADALAKIEEAYRFAAEYLSNISKHVLPKFRILETQIIFILLCKDPIYAPVALLHQFGKHHKCIVCGC